MSSNGHSHPLARRPGQFLPKWEKIEGKVPENDEALGNILEKEKRDQERVGLRRYGDIMGEAHSFQSC